MNGQIQDQNSQQWEEPNKNIVSRPWLLRHPLAWRRARRHQRTNQVNNQRLAWRVQDVLVGCGLSQADYSIGGGRGFHIPQVISVSNSPPVTLDIRMLPGQTPKDFITHAPAIAYDLGVAEVRVTLLEVPLIRLELLPLTR